MTRLLAVQRAEELVSREPLYLDTETTGLGASAEIVDICLLDASGTPLVDTLVRPSSRIPRASTDIHGITDEMVAHAPSWAEVWPSVARASAGRWVGIYNVGFDANLIRRCNARSGLLRQGPAAHTFCIMNLYSAFVEGEHERWRRHRLAHAVRDCGLMALGEHRARIDAQQARGVLHFMAASDVPGRL